MGFWTRVRLPPNPSSSEMNSVFHGDIAQLGERCVRNAKVAGSNPVVSIGYDKRRCRMGFFDKLGDTVTEVGNNVSLKAKEVSEITRLNAKIRTDKTSMKEAYESIGKKVYECRKSGAELPDFTSEMEIIERMKKDIELCNEHIRMVKGTEICSECGSEVESGSSYCKHCGAKVNK